MTLTLFQFTIYSLIFLMVGCVIGIGVICLMAGSKQADEHAENIGEQNRVPEEGR